MLKSARHYVFDESLVLEAGVSAAGRTADDQPDPVQFADSELWLRTLG